MTDITTPMIIDDIARHLCTCAALVGDPEAAQSLNLCADVLRARAKELRHDPRPPRIKTSDVPKAA